MNLSHHILMKLRVDFWECFICNPEPKYNLRAKCWAAHSVYMNEKVKYLTGNVVATSVIQPIISDDGKFNDHKEGNEKKGLLSCIQNSERTTPCIQNSECTEMHTIDEIGRS